MSLFFKNLLLKFPSLSRKSGKQGSITKSEFEKAARILAINFKNYLKDAFLIITGIFLAAFGFKGFLLTNHFIDGGATGISLLISALSGIPLSILIVCVNLPFIIMAYRVVGKVFTIKTSLAIAGLAIVLATVEFPNITNDNLLVAIFGGFFLGAGIGQ